MQQRVVNANNNNTVIYTIPSNSQPIRVLTTQNSQYVHPNNNMTHNYSSNVNPATGNYDVITNFSFYLK